MKRACSFNSFTVGSITCEFHPALKNKKMKKLAVLPLAVLIFLAMGQVQAITLTPKNVNATNRAAKNESKAERRELRKIEISNSASTITKDNFYADYGDVPGVNWHTSNYYEEATFMKDGIQETAFYDFYGKLVGATMHKTFADLPAKGQKRINAEYKGYEIGAVIFFDDNELNDMNMVLYNTEFQDEDNYFVELKKGAEQLIVRSDVAGNISLFKKL